MTKIRSLHYLRGIASLLVLYAHVLVVGTTDPVTPGSYFPMIKGIAFPPEQFEFLNLFHAPEIWIERFRINAGSLGVGAFFLLSGYLILATVERKSAKVFAIGRFYRIYPVAAVTTIGGAIIYSAYITANGYDTTYSIGRTLLSALLLPAYRPPNPVIWSLIVEVWFYVVLGIAFYVGRSRFGLAHVLSTAAACLTVVAILTSLRLVLPEQIALLEPVSTLLWHIPYSMTFVIFILAGAAIYRAQRDREYLGGVFAVVILLAMFLGAERLFDQTYPGTMGFHFPNAIASTLLFTGFLLLEPVMPRLSVLNFFANVSYPLYLVHIPLAWLLFYKLASLRVPGAVSFVIVCAICIFLAYILHKMVEVPSHRFGRNFERLPEDSPVKASVS